MGQGCLGTSGAVETRGHQAGLHSTVRGEKEKLGTTRRFWHPHTGITALLQLLSTTTELVVINLISQHDPQTDPKLASHGHARLPETFLD